MSLISLTLSNLVYYFIVRLVLSSTKSSIKNELGELELKGMITNSATKI